MDDRVSLDLVSGKLNEYQLQPDIDCEHIQPPEHLNNDLCYLAKPMDIVTPYRNARNQLENDTDRKALNLELSWVPDTIMAAGVYRKMLKCTGSMHGRSSAFVGVPKKDRPKRKQAVISLLNRNSAHLRASEEDEIMESYARGLPRRDVVSD